MKVKRIQVNEQPGAMLQASLEYHEYSGTVDSLKNLVKQGAAIPICFDLVIERGDLTAGLFSWDSVPGQAVELLSCFGIDNLFLLAGTTAREVRAKYSLTDFGKCDEKAFVLRSDIVPPTIRMSEDEEVGPQPVVPFMAVSFVNPALVAGLVASGASPSVIRLDAVVWLRV